MQIRRAVREDKKELARLIKEFESSDQYLSEIQRRNRAYTDIDKMSEETAEDYFSKPEYIVFVADENRALKGYICGEIKEKKYRVYNKEGYVVDWFVDDKYQNQGVGKGLFDRLVEAFDKAGCTHVGLDTHLENEKAVKIYEKMGFTKRLVTFFKPLKDLP